jgi:cellulose synthase operon protein C
MRRTLAIAILTAAPLAVCAVLATSQSAAEPILGEESLGIPADNVARKPETADALALFKARDYDGSLKLWKEAVKKNPDLPPAQVIMAQLFFQSNMPKEAQIALDQAINDVSDDPEAYILMASLAMRDRDITKAQLLFEKAGSLLAAFDKSPKRKEAMQVRLQSGMAAMAEARKDWTGAQKSLNALLKLDPKNAAAMQRVAYGLFQQKNVDGALEKLREAAKADPLMLTPEAVLAQFYQRAGDRENVTKWMTAAVTAAPKNVKTQLAAGQWALETGRLDDARKHSIAAIRIDPKLQQVKLFRGAIAMFERDYEAAESYFESALKQSPNDFSLRNNLAVALIEQPDAAKNRRALEFAEANVKQFPQAVEAASTYGWVLYKLNRVEDAEKALVAAAPAASTDLDVAYVIARVSVDRGRKAEAKQLLETALKLTAPALFRQEAEDLLEQLKK